MLGIVLAAAWHTEQQATRDPVSNKEGGKEWHLNLSFDLHMHAMAHMHSYIHTNEHLHTEI